MRGTARALEQYLLSLKALLLPLDVEHREDCCEECSADHESRVYSDAFTPDRYSIEGTSSTRSSCLYGDQQRRHGAAY
jgi:hypothetical protein